MCINIKGVMFMNNIYNNHEIFGGGSMNDSCTRVFLAFEWRIKDIIKYLPIIKHQGFNAIEITPMQPLKTDRPDIPWYLYFQPVGFRIGNQVGSKQDLIELCTDAKKYGIRIIADVVCCHVADGDYGEFMINKRVDKEINRPEFFKPLQSINNWDDRHEVITKCLKTLPALNLANYELQDIIIRFLNEYIECGVRGFRFDAAKQIPLPHEEYPFSMNHHCDFWTRVLTNLNHKEELFNYAEVLHYPKELIDMYTPYIHVITQNIGSDPDKIVSYISNHDTEKEFGSTSQKKDEEIIELYKILASRFKHTQFYARPFHNDWMTSNELRYANYQMR